MSNSNSKESPPMFFPSSRLGSDFGQRWSGLYLHNFINSIIVIRYGLFNHRYTIDTPTENILAVALTGEVMKCTHT